jgi:hypothetical protein
MCDGVHRQHKFFMLIQQENSTHTHMHAYIHTYIHTSSLNWRVHTPTYMQNCIPCATSSCPPGYFRSLCTPQRDSECVPCTGKPSYARYSGTGAASTADDACAWECMPGYFRSGSTCSTCSTTDCPIGMYRLPCYSDSDGTCVPCSSPMPSEGAKYSSTGLPFDLDNCTWACSEGYVQVNDTCVTAAQVCILVYMLCRITVRGIVVRGMCKSTISASLWHRFEFLYILFVGM